VDLTNGGTRETEQELYASPHLPTQSPQVAGGDHHYCYIDAAHTESGDQSDSTVLYEDPTSPSYVVCHWVFTAAPYSDCALYSVVVLSLLRDCLAKHFCSTQSQEYSTIGVFNSIGTYVPTEVKGSSYMCIQYTNTECTMFFHRRRELLLRVAMKWRKSSVRDEVQCIL